MNKPNVTTIIKVIGLGLSVGGMIATAIATSRQNNETLNKLFDSKFNNQQ